LNGILANCGIPGGLLNNNCSTTGTGCAAFAGRGGILEHVARAAAAEQIHSASAYCERCRETTWLCDAEAASLDAAVVDFALNVQRARAVEHALAVARARNRVPPPS
jgi:hypothetical protein